MPTITLSNPDKVQVKLKELRKELHQLYYYRTAALEHEQAELNAALWELEELAAGSHRGKVRAATSRDHNAGAKRSAERNGADQSCYVSGYIQGLAAYIEKNLSIEDTDAQS